MDLKTYLQSELEEEAALPPPAAAPRSSTGPAGSAYPGDPDVRVAETEVVTERVKVHEHLEVEVARPSGSGPAPAVVVIHENKGLVPYIENVARRLAVRGYVAVAPDLLSRLGGTAAFQEQADVITALGTLDADDVVADVRAVVAYTADREDVDADRVGILGFCYGGGVAWRVLTQEPRISAGVPFYGPTPDADAVPGIQAPVLAVYGETDQRITSMLPEISEAMARHGKTFEAVVLEGAGHAFHNDTNPDRYDPDAARQAWETAVAWLDRWLKDA